MSRGRKLIIVSLVLALGLALAWPFRKTGREKNYDSVAEAVPALSQPETAEVGDSTPILQAPQLGSPAPHVVAKMTNIPDVNSPIAASQSVASFDLANHPALASTPLQSTNSPVTPAVPPSIPARVSEPEAMPEQTIPATSGVSRQARPAYQTVQPGQVFDPAELDNQEVRHVVQNHDTLEKLAKRYLGDEGRALEIFDLNRDVLDNPHLLPINAELRIPQDARVTLE